MQQVCKTATNLAVDYIHCSIPFHTACWHGFVVLKKNCWYILLADHCIPISEVAGRQHLRSARRQQLNVPRIHHVIGHCVFASAGPTVWNSLPDNLRDSTVGPDQFQRELKTHLFSCLLNTSSTVR